MRILKVAAAVMAACAVTGTIGTPTAMAQSACAELGGTVGPDQTCAVHAENDTYLLDFTFPAQYPDQQAVADYLTQARVGFVNVSEMPGSRGLPYVLDAKGTGYRSGLPWSAPRVWCSRCTRTSAARVRRPTTSRSTGTSPPRRPSRSTRCSNRAPNRST